MLAILANEGLHHLFEVHLDFRGDLFDQLHEQLPILLGEYSLLSSMEVVVMLTYGVRVHPLELDAALVLLV